MEAQEAGLGPDLKIQKVVDELVVEEMDKLAKREREVLERVAQLAIQHEDVVVIHRHENIDTLTFLEVTEKTISGRRRSSWYGKILKISPVDSGDDVREKKKKDIKEGDIVIYNPESAYSLNIAGFEEIWILHLDNILVTDAGYDYVATKKANLAKRFEVQQRMHAHQMQMQQAADTANRINKNNGKR